jgi:hypothetical protein
LPLKITIFMWFLNRKVWLTKDNLVKRQWKGCKKCCFCDADESVEPLFLHVLLLKLFGALSWSVGHI